MSTRSEALFAKLHQLEALNGLIGTAEDAEVEYKEWRGYDANKGSLSKAACAFANATGGVLVIGIMAANQRSGEADVATELRPIPEIEAVKAAALDIILKQVDPGVEGVQAVTVAASPGSRDGYLVIHVPESPLPQRSRPTKEFYVRIASGSVPMEMFQIADRFGRRPSARLTVALSKINYDAFYPYGPGVYRSVQLQVINEGRGLARYPAIFYKSEIYLQSSTMSVPEWPTAATTPPWRSQRGGANDVVYPGEIRTIIELFQSGNVEKGVVTFPSLTINTRVVCLEMPEFKQVHVIEAADTTTKRSA